MRTKTAEETNQELANPALEGRRANWRTKQGNQVEEFAQAPMKQECGEVMPPLGDRGTGTTQKGEKKRRHKRRWKRSHASRLQGEKWSNTTPPRRLATTADAAVAKLSPGSETTQSKQTDTKW
jgi:hypothetical protein